MAAPSTEERELKLLESVEFKILAVANKETKLHELLQRYLAPVILKAASENQSVRQRVGQHLFHIFDSDGCLSMNLCRSFRY
jgi:proteasome component ECM29